MPDSFFNALSLATLGEFHFLRPWWALALLPILAVLVHHFSRNLLNKRWQSIIAPHILRYLLIDQSSNRLFNPFSLLCLLMVLFVLILMGPAWSRQPSPFLQHAGALVVVLDVSRSMLSDDVQPSRLERAKQKISDLLRQRQDSRNGVIVFAGSAHTVLPLTNDAEILQLYLKAISPTVMPRRGKFPEKVLPLLDLQFKDDAVPATVVLITDGIGANSQSIVGGYFAEKPWQLLVLGVGKTRQELVDLNGADVPPLETQTLRKLASISGGQYIDLTLDEGDINRIVRAVDSYFVTADDEQVPWVDQGYYLLFLGLLLFLPWFRKGWSIQWVLILGVSTALYSPANSYADDEGFLNWWVTPDQQGRWYFSKQQYVEAGQRFEDVMWKGVSYYMAEQFILAAEYFARVDSEEALFNLANTLAHAESYVVARELYGQILKRNPAHPRARHNLQIVERIIEDINRMSESQRQEAGDAPKEMSAQTPQWADGADERVFESKEAVQFSAEEIMQDKSVNEMWMKSVQRDPSQFLASKFDQQLAGEEK